MIETALVFDREGRTIHWHEPRNRSAGHIADDRGLWDVLWENRLNLGGVAHTHPWVGPAWPSRTDVTTFSACEQALGRRLVWPVVTFDQETQFSWAGPGPYDYAPAPVGTGIGVQDIEELRLRSR